MNDEKVRLASFEWLNELSLRYGDVLPWAELSNGFLLDGERVTLIGQKGIWKPKVIDRYPISITTSVGGPYKDSMTNDGFIAYAYRGTDPSHSDNIILRNAMRDRIPLIYFRGLARGKYFAAWPVYVIHDDPGRLTFTVAVDDHSLLEHIERTSEQDWDSESVLIRRRYITSEVRTRLHQRAFREVVIGAYRERCAFCNLHHPELLDASHIIPDSDEWGEPEVTNGLSLCKIHHAAFDANILGVDPDYRISVREDILREKDGPMLRYGLQGLKGQQLILPRKRQDWPNRERLEERYKRFRQAG